MSQTKAQLLDGKSATIQFTGGSASAPSVSFTGDTNTGIYSPGADQVAISTNSTQRLLIDASGNVGIGITNPAFAVGSGVEIERDSASATLRLQRINTGGSILEIRADDGKTVIDSRQASTDLAFQTNSTERLRITSAGLVGIGTSSPSYKLTVYDGSIFSGSAGNTVNIPGLRIRERPAAGGNPGSNYIECGEFADIGNDGSGTDGNKFVVTNAGRVGIGTQSPDYTLNVQGTVGIGKVGTSGTYNLFWAPNTVAQQVKWIRNNSGELSIGAGTTAGSSEQLRLDDQGRLLVGTSSALDTSLIGAAAFQVAGGTNATSQLSVSRFSGNSDLPRIALIKSRSGTVGSNAIVQNGDGLGEVAFIGADGSGATGYPFAASIGAYVDGTPGTNDMPGRLVFSTCPDGDSSPDKRMQIDSGSNTIFYGTGEIETARFTGARNLLIGGTLNPTSATNSIGIVNGTAPTASITDGVVLYAQDVSASSELRVRDEAGNVTTLSPHNFELIPEGPSEDMAWSYYSERDGKRINVDMLKAIRLLEQLTGEKLVFTA